MNSNVTGTSDDEDEDGKKAMQFSTTYMVNCEQLPFSCLCSKVSMTNNHFWAYTWKLKWTFWHSWFPYSLLSSHMKTKVVQHVPRIKISFWHKTCDMRNVICDMQNVACDIITTLTVELTYEKKVVEHVPQINISIWHVTWDMWHVTLLQKFTVELTHVCPKDQ